MVPVEDVKLEIVTSHQEDPGRKMAVEDDIKLAREAVDTLPERQQEIVRLKFQNGLSYREISRITEMSVSNVGVTLHNAIKAIRKQINPEPVVQQVGG